MKNTGLVFGIQCLHVSGSDSDVGSDASNVCYMVQGDNPLEVTTESEVDEDVDMSYDELTSFCQQLLEKYDMLKKDNKNCLLYTSPSPRDS